MSFADGASPLLGQTAAGSEDEIDFHAQSRSERTGGDFFDAVRVGPYLAFLLSDIAGRRPELDPIAAEMQRAFRASATGLFTAPSVNLMEAAESLIIAINNALIAVANGVRFAPSMVGCYDAQLGILAYINAGGQTALFHDSEGTRTLPNASVPLGLFTHMTYDAAIQAFEPGATLLVVTKGVTDNLGSNDQSAQEKIIEVLRASTFDSASAVCTAVLETAHRLEKHQWDWLPFKGKMPPEDMTALALLRLPASH